MKKSFGSQPLAFATPVWCVGTYDADGKPNVMTIAWGGICCSKPACLTVSLRKATYSYGNIMARKAYTVSVPSTAYAAQADFFGMVSGRDVDKFAATNLTPEKAEFVDAPYVAEFPMVIECALLHTLEVGLHTLFVGEIKDVKIDAACVNENGKPDMAKVAPFVFGPEARRYLSLGDDIGQAFSIGDAFRNKG